MRGISSEKGGGHNKNVVVEDTTRTSPLRESMPDTVDQWKTFVATKETLYDDYLTNGGDPSIPFEETSLEVKDDHGRIFLLPREHETKLISEYKLTVESLKDLRIRDLCLINVVTGAQIKLVIPARTLLDMKRKLLREYLRRGGHETKNLDDVSLHLQQRDGYLVQVPVEDEAKPLSQFGLTMFSRTVRLSLRKSGTVIFADEHL